MRVTVNPLIPAPALEMEHLTIAPVNMDLEQQQQLQAGGPVSPLLTPIPVCQSTATADQSAQQVQTVERDFPDLIPVGMTMDLPVPVDLKMETQVQADLKLERYPVGLTMELEHQAMEHLPTDMKMEIPVPIDLIMVMELQDLTMELEEEAGEMHLTKKMIPTLMEPNLGAGGIKLKHQHKDIQV